jgi:DNA polymerase (family 10)
MGAPARLLESRRAPHVENIDVARIFQQIADLLEIQGENQFRIRAYRNAARTVETLSRPVASLVGDEKALEQLPGIGADLAGKIREIVETGTLPLLKQLTRRTPATLVQLMHVPGLGPKRAKLIHQKLHVKTIEDLERAVRTGRLHKVRGFKDTLEARILKGIGEQKAQGGRVTLATADAYVAPLVAYLKKLPGVTRLEVAGSYRRRRETVGDLDLLVAASRGAPIGRQFLAYPDIREVLASGPTRCSAVLKSGLQVDLRIVPAVSFGAALHYFTGSKPHNIAVRTLGVKRGLKINEYGVFRKSRRIAGRNEADVFAAVGLPWIPPELREDRGELEAARAGTLPTLVTLDDLKGDLQMHTTYTDGRQDLKEMVQAAAELGHRYIAISDHTREVRVAGGIGRREFLKQFREIDRVQKSFRNLTILKGAEVDILEDGRLDLDETTLKELDLIVASVHSKLDMPRAAMTRRILRALEHPRVHILGHPSGRLLGRREPSPIDMEAVVKAAVAHGVLLEINAQPDRLDLNDVNIRMARDAGALLVISSDAHRTEELKCLRYGVDQARRGWCEPRHIANTRTLPDFMKLLKRA